MLGADAVVATVAVTDELAGATPIPAVGIVPKTEFAAVVARATPDAGLCAYVCAAMNAAPSCVDCLKPSAPSCIVPSSTIIAIPIENAVSTSAAPREKPIMAG